MSTADWSIDDRLEHRRQAARRRVDERTLEALRRRREWRRDMARAGLAVALIVLGFLCIEMGSKAVTLLAGARSEIAGVL